MTRGAGWFSPPNALARKRSAAAASGLAERRKSIVAPLESRARVTLDPSPHRDVIGAQAPLGQEFLYIAIREREAQIPTDGQENHLRFKLAPLEQTGNRWDEEHPSILAASLSGQASKVATLP